MKIAALLAVVAFASCSKVNPPPAPESKDMAAGAGGEKASMENAETWTVRDNGKRCVVAPCPSWTAKNVTSGDEIEITGIDLTGAGLAESDIGPTREKLLSGKANAVGSIKTVPAAGPAGDGRVLFVVKILPRA